MVGVATRAVRMYPKEQAAYCLSNLFGTTCSLVRAVIAAVEKRPQDMCGTGE